ncbi:MAG TPA: helix-turn-helix domain-containing protein [Solirubrobacteraceae bacterium]|jgi:cytoskeletal protein RodZ|nr:helix-turn-helix domain-containing protein [Solirubrobacteraceae bacterium]
MADEIGSRLREARMRAKIDINEVETRTKIRAKYLRAMENEEWDLLPGEVYVKSFLRTYGEYLGLDTRQLIDDFRRRYERLDDHELRPIAPLGRDRDRTPRRRGIPPWLVIAAVLVVVVVVLFFVGQNSPGPKSPSTTQAGTTTTHRARHRPRKRRVHKAVPTTVKLQLQPTGQVYVCLVDSTGKKLIPGLIFNTGQTIPTKSASKLLLTLGNNNVKMTVNGVSVPVPASAGSIGYRLVPGGHSALSPAQQPKCA